MADSPIVEQIAGHADATPEAPAVTDRTGTVTFGRLWQEASACAGLVARYAGEDAAVGVLLPNCALFVAALLGAARVGRPAILFPTTLTGAEIRTYCRAAGTRIVLTGSERRGFVEAAGGRLLAPGRAGLECFDLEGRSDLHAKPDRPAPGGRVQPGDFIGQLTSGVDDPSRIAVRTHAAVWTEIHSFAEEIRLTAHDTAFVLSAISHSYGLIGGTLAPLCRGGQVILGDRLLVEEVLRIARRMRPTLLFAVPVTYRGLAARPEGTREDLASLRCCFSAGGPLPRDVDDRFAARFGPRICQDYGTTEAGVICLRLAWAPQRANSVGRPVPHNSVAVVDGQGQPVPSGGKGEVVVRSPALARGYLGMQPNGASSLTDDRFATGDLGWIDGEGDLFLAGRKTGLIHVAGAEIDPAEVEAVIGTLPGVQEVAVVGVPGPPPGERLKAVVVAEGITAARIQQHCRAYLADRQVPEIIEFREAIPRTPAGKVLRRALRPGTGPAG